MKITQILSLAATAVLLAACNKDDINGNKAGNMTGQPVPMTFTAAIPQTRTQLDGLNVHWSEWDEIALWDGSGSYQKLMVDNESIKGSTATFSGPAVAGADYTAFYPLMTVESMDASTVRFNLTAEQTPVAGSFANNLAPSLAKATGGSTNLVFNNLCALMKFTVGTDMAGDGTFTLVGGNATEPLAGQLTCNTDDGTLTATEAATRITLMGNFVAGQSYCFVVAPGTLEKGFSLLYENSDGELYRKATNNYVALTAGRSLDLGVLALADGFEKAIIKELFPITKSGTGIPNADGTVILSDTDLSALAEVTTLNVSNKNLTSLGGIGYYTGLKQLYCGGNNLAYLNIGGLTMLEELFCPKCGLTFLNIKGSNMKTLYCNGNKLTSLNLSGVTGLVDLYCSDNRMLSLDISQLSLLEDLGCGRQEGRLTLLLTWGQAQIWNIRWWEKQYNEGVDIKVVTDLS